MYIVIRYIIIIYLIFNLSACGINAPSKANLKFKSEISLTDSLPKKLVCDYDSLNLIGVFDLKSFYKKEYCDEAVVTLINRKTKDTIQKLEIKNCFYKMKEENYSSEKGDSFKIIDYIDIQMDDYGFDGYKDLAVNTGNLCGYGALSYNIYLFDKANKKYIYSEELTDLAIEGVGLFDIDHERKRILVHQRAGYGNTVDTEYKIINNLPRKIKIVTVSDEEFLETGRYIHKTEELVNGKWIMKTKKVKND